MEERLLYNRIRTIMMHLNIDIEEVQLSTSSSTGHIFIKGTKNNVDKIASIFNKPGKIDSVEIIEIKKNKYKIYYLT